MTTIATHPATHKIGPLLYRKTERAIFRLSTFNEWVRSNISTREFRLNAKSTASGQQSKTQKEQLTREERYLQDIDNAAALIKEHYTKDTMPSANKIHKELGIGHLTSRRAHYMIKQNKTAVEARKHYKAPSRKDRG